MSGTEGLILSECFTQGMVVGRLEGNYGLQMLRMQIAVPAQRKLKYWTAGVRFAAGKGLFLLLTMSR
jgi:hypothetical protein